MVLHLTCQVILYCRGTYVSSAVRAGVGAMLANMQNETDTLSKNVVERVRTALDNLAALDMFTE